MFKKLKKKFILINMALLTTLFMGMLGVIYLMTSQNLEREISMSLNKAMHGPPKDKVEEDRLEEDKLEDKMLYDKPEVGKFDRTIIIDLDNNNNIISVSSIFNLDAWEIEDIIKEILSNNENLGKIKIDGDSYSYLKQESGIGVKIALINRNEQQGFLGNLLRIFVLVGCLSLIILYLVSLYLTNRAIKPIEESFKKQKRFITDASHELRTPLTIIKTNTSVVLANEDDTIKNQSKWIKYIDSQVNRMSVLIDEMLSLAKIDTDKKKIELVPINISKIVNDALLNFEVLIFERGFQLEENISKDIYVKGEKEQLKKLVNILMDNAIKYTNSNGKISVSLLSEKNKMKLIVTNSGEGIPKEHLEKIFGRFYRVDASRNRGTGGYGLGLSIAKSTVEQYKGNIYVESIVGKETSFIIELPI